MLKIKERLKTEWLRFGNAIILSALLAGCSRDRAASDADLSNPRQPTSLVTLELEHAKELGIEAVGITPLNWTKTRRVYGRVVPNPNATYEVLSASPGVIHSISKPWPRLGETVESGQVLGYVAVRMSPEVRFDLELRLAETKLKVSGEEEIVRVLTGTADSLRKVTQREILSRAELDSAVVNLERAKLQLNVNRATVKRIEQSLNEIDAVTRDQKSLWYQPIVASHNGEVTEVYVAQGANVESGRSLLQIVDFQSPLIRLDLPSEATSTSINELNIQIANEVLNAKRVGTLSSIESAGQFQSTLFEVTMADPTLTIRSGMQAIAEFPIDGNAVRALSIPSSSVVVHEGLSYVYVQLSDDEFQRREVHLLQRSGANWIVARDEDSTSEVLGLTDTDRVVAFNPQLLLSKQFLKSGGDTD